MDPVGRGQPPTTKGQRLVSGGWNLDAGWSSRVQSGDWFANAIISLNRVWTSLVCVCVRVRLFCIGKIKNAALDFTRRALASFFPSLSIAFTFGRVVKRCRVYYFVPQH